MLALVGSEALGKATAFPTNNVTEELVNEVVHLAENTIPLYGELLVHLEEKGRSDLVRAINSKIAEFHQRQTKEKWKKRTIEPIAEFDKKHLKGNLKKLKNLALN